MPDFIVRLHSQSLVRLNQNAYEDDGPQPSLVLNLFGDRIAIIDGYKSVSSEIRSQDGLIIQVKLSAANINSAIDESIGFAENVLSILTLVAKAAIDTPIAIWAYDASLGIEQREFRYCSYEGAAPRATRPLNNDHLLHFFETNFNSFLARPEIRLDFKKRVQNGVFAFRRGLADNKDVLNEFFNAWSAIEGLDCVYREVFPSITCREFRDGMKDIFKRLGHSEVFDTLQGLRDAIAHGNLTLQEATQTASDYLEVTRNALILTVLRIINVDATATDQIVNQPSYKGKARPHRRYLAKMSFVPVDVDNFEGQPNIRVLLQKETFAKSGQNLTHVAYPEIEPVIPENISFYGREFWGEQGVPLKVTFLEPTLNDRQKGEQPDLLPIAPPLKDPERLDPS